MTTIRDYLPTDLEKTAAVWLTSTIKGQPFLSEEYWLKVYRSIYHTLLPDRWQTFVAEVDGEIEGMLSLCAPGVISALFVGPSCQRKGHASSLLETVKARFDRLEVSVYIQNEHALSFFEKNGFVPLRQEIEAETGLEQRLYVWTRASDGLTV